jgi:SAM-dependent methyltransferase
MVVALAQPAEHRIVAPKVTGSSPVGHPIVASGARSTDRTDPAYRGQSDYSRLVLSLYDRLVLGPIARFVWRTPTPRLLEEYRQHIREPHLDVGPGTGYFIGRSGLPQGSRVTILDPNRNVLDHAAQRLRHLKVTAVEADVLKPLPVRGPFASAALHLVLHCLPGPLSRKAVAVSNVASVLEPTGVLFGASVLGTSGSHTWPARRMLYAFNRRGAFDNLDDTEDGLRSILEESFAQVDLEIVGSTALFRAARPRVHASH